MITNVVSKLSLAIIFSCIFSTMSLGIDANFGNKFNSQAKKIFGHNIQMTLEKVECTRDKCYWSWYRNHELVEDAYGFTINTVIKGENNKIESESFITTILSLVYTKDLNEAKRIANRLIRNCTFGIYENKRMAINFSSNDGSMCSIMIFEKDI